MWVVFRIQFGKGIRGDFKNKFFGMVWKVVGKRQFIVRLLYGQDNETTLIFIIIFG